MEDALYLKLLGATGEFGVNEMIYVPATGWSKQNAYFDGLKYCGPVMQNPYNALNVDKKEFHLYKQPKLSIAQVVIPTPNYDTDEERLNV